MQIADLIVNPIKEWKYEIIAFVIITFILGILQLIFLNQGFENPGILGYFYLSNFINFSWYLFFINIFVMWFGLLFIFILSKREEKVRLWLNVFFIFIVGPLLLSLLNILFITTTTGKTTLGFSGISSIFLGYGIFTFALFLYTAWKNNFLKRNFNKCQISCIIGFLILLPIISLIFFADPIEFSLIISYGVIEGIYQTFVQTKINIFIHVVGYLIGLFLPLTTRKYFN